MLLGDYKAESVMGKVVLAGQQEEVSMGSFGVYLVKNLPVCVGIQQAVLTRKGMHRPLMPVPDIRQRAACGLLRDDD